MEWFKVDSNRKKNIIEQSSVLTGIPENAIEKDFWISMLLKVIFELPYGENILFKGGTSLSKGWKLIDRFSEDIDLAISPLFLGFNNLDSKRSIERLRENVYHFTIKRLKDDIQSNLIKLGVPQDSFDIDIERNAEEKEPVSLVFEYKSILNVSNLYVLPKIKIDVGGRSLYEPFVSKFLNTIIFETYPNIAYTNVPSNVKTVLPERTFLEKVFLLHEEFHKEPEKVRYVRLSRHLYDIFQIYARFGSSLLDEVLFEKIKLHRTKFSPIKGTNYGELTFSKISFVPIEPYYEKYENDYKLMFDYMIYNPDKPNWNELYFGLIEIQQSFNNWKNK